METVVVIGAGISGLVCAQALRFGDVTLPSDEQQQQQQQQQTTRSNSTKSKEPAFNVVVLEALGRVGGRLRSVQLSSGTHVDVGASHITSCNLFNPLYYLFTTAKLAIDTKLGGYSNGERFALRLGVANVARGALARYLHTFAIIFLYNFIKPIPIETCIQFVIR
jgi:flavin-dependent dehydrogenase